MRYILLPTIAALALAGCQTVAPIAKTPSGRPQAVFNMEPQAVAEKLAERCLSGGLMLLDQSAGQLTCGQTMTGAGAVLGRLMIGNSYSTTPDRKIRFAISKVGEKTVVQAYQWIETQMAYGQVRRQELNDGAQFNDVQRMLYSIGGRAN